MSILKNYFKTLYRSFKRDLFYSLINLFGLAIGLASAFLIFIYIQNELEYDKYYKDFERIYRLESYFTIKGKPDEFAITQIPLGPALKDEYPEIESFVRLMPGGTLIFEHEGEIYQEDSLMVADSNFFCLFGIELLHGEPGTCLNEPYTIALSSPLAEKYFGRTDVIGEQLEDNEGEVFTVKAIFKPLPENTHIRFNGLISSASIAKKIGEERFNDRSAGAFWNVQVFTFIKMKKNSSFSDILNKFPAFYDKYMKSVGDQIEGNFELRGTPVAEIHYHQKKLQWDAPTGEPKYLYILGSVALFILIIATINYMNLSTARSSRRSREVGMRKVSGANKSLLIKQFLSESVLLSLLSMVIAFLIILAILPFFNDLSGKHFTITRFIKPGIIIAFAAITIIVGILSGLYPAFYLSSFDPVKILKGGFNNKPSGGGLRTALIIFQFMISAGLIVGSLAVSSQLSYMQNKDLGFNEDNLIVLSIRDTTIRKNLEAFKQELEKSPLIIETAAFNGGPGSFVGKNVMRVEGENGEMEDVAVNNFIVDHDYANLMEFEIDTGRFFSKEMKSDKENAFIINESTAREFNWHSTALGKNIHYGIRIESPPLRSGEVIGVLSDFNYKSLHNPVEPVIIALEDDNMAFGNLGIRIAKGSKKEAINWIETTRESFQPYFPFDYFFMDEKLNESYREEQIISRVFRSFTILTLFVAALGLLGLSAFITQQRTKEVGIRKVVGSSPEQILGLFIRRFLLWVLIANLLAFPVAYFLIIDWLQDFYFRVDFNFLIFVWALLISIAVAVITVSYQTLKASGLQPARSLRYE